MTQISCTVSYRVANRDDETDVLAVLEDVAPEIPVRLDGPERQEKIQTIIQQCHRSGESWVAVDANGKVIGFLLARPDAHEGRAAISVQYVGVTVGSRRRGVFSTLIEKLKANSVPLIATVEHGRSPCEEWVCQNRIQCQADTISMVAQVISCPGN